MIIQAFQPFIPKNASLLILGSFPSVKSREENFYYGNPTNRFYKTLADFFCNDLPLTIGEKKAFLASHGIALWDMVASCEIVGSMDTNIKNPTIIDLKPILESSDIKYIILNGKKSEALFLKYFQDIIIPHCYLPSTSPANVSFKAEIWHKKLEEIFN